MKKLIRMMLVTILLSASLFAFAYIPDEDSITTDMAIVQSIKAQIAADKSVSNLKINLESTEGVVHLSGTTNTDKEASRIVEIAESTVGVKDVNTEDFKTKKSIHPLDDTFITAKVKGVFIREKLFGDHAVSPMSISVETKNGVVYLTGSVDNRNQIDTAIKLARTIDGVKDVQSKVIVK